MPHTTSSKHGSLAGDARSFASDVRKIVSSSELYFPDGDIVLAVEDTITVGSKNWLEKEKDKARGKPKRSIDSEATIFSASAIFPSEIIAHSTGRGDGLEARQAPTRPVDGLQVERGLGLVNNAADMATCPLAHRL